MDEASVADVVVIEDMTAEQVALAWQDVTAECTFEKDKRVRIKHNGRTVGILTCDGSYMLLLDVDADGRSVLRALKHG